MSLEEDDEDENGGRGGVFPRRFYDEEGNEVDTGGRTGTVARKHHAALLDAATTAPDRAHDLDG